MIIIRPYQPSDTDSIIALFYETVHEVCIRDYSPEQVDAWAPRKMDRTQWAGRLRAKETIVADEDGVVVGFGELEATGHIGCLYVHKERQRQGIGGSILAAIQCAAAQKGLSHLFTEASITAKSFFEHAGFRVVQDQTVVVRNVAMTNFVMEKRLGGL